MAGVPHMSVCGTTANPQLMNGGKAVRVCSSGDCKERWYQGPAGPFGELNCGGGC
jgi:hypothetical protein